MNIFPAIDLYDGMAVRLLQGDYNQMTVYKKNAAIKAAQFEAQGAKHLHIVDLNGARGGSPQNFDVISSIVSESKLKIQVGGGIRNEETIKEYLNAGAERVILGTAALEGRKFLGDMVLRYGDKIAVGVDLMREFVAVNGWTKMSEVKFFDYMRDLCGLGVETVICTDISRDGAMFGPNHKLYEDMTAQFPLVNIIASGGVSSLEDVRRLARVPLCGAIIGRALYNGAINLSEALAEAE